MQWQDTKLHARMRTATLLQWQDTMLTNAHCCPAAVATATATAMQQCSNSNSNNNNKARCIPAELCKLSRVK
jgi:hypothetical protein